MPTLPQLGRLLTACRAVSVAQWQRAAGMGGGNLTRTLDTLAAGPPEWWSPATAVPGEEPPPGLTEYQRGVIEEWFAGGPAPHRRLALNQFLLLDKLGQGGQGTVFRARQLSPARYVAVKALTQGTETGRRRFEQEARAMMRVRHPAVARFHLYERVRDTAGQPTDEYLIAMEYVPGTDLHRLVRWVGAVPWQFAARWTAELLGGLAMIHHNGFVHRDVKPANVMIVGPAPGPGVAPTATAAKLLDFGAVKPSATPGGTGMQRTFVGTREYAPPEQWLEQVVPASDLYALGGTLFYALTGRPPFVVEGRDAMAFMRAHARDPAPDVREITPDVPEELAILINKMLAKDPDNRGTAAELLPEFRELLPPDARTTELEVPQMLTPPPRDSVIRKVSAARAEPDPPEEETGSGGIVGLVLTALERVFLPARLRLPPGHEPPLGERVLALLRRPLVLLVLLTLLVGLVLLVMSAQ